MYPMAAILVKRVQGSRIIKNPNNKDVKIFTICDLRFTIYAAKLQKKMNMRKNSCSYHRFFVILLRETKIIDMVIELQHACAAKRM
jgi:hypothetical protein